MTLAHDHVIWLVPDASRLDETCARFRQAGFTITTRPDEGRDTAATAQKLICFEDGTYIEILSLRAAGTRQNHRFARFLSQGEGWVDYALVTTGLTRVIRAAEAADLPFSGPASHARRLDDGSPWGVRLILTGIGAGDPAMPIILEDTEGRAFRVPQQATRHANGVTGMPGVSLVARDPALTLGSLEKIGARRDGETHALLRGGWIRLMPGEPDHAPALRSVSFSRPGGKEGAFPEADAAGLTGLRIG